MDIVQFEFLPFGADQNAAVYRADTVSGKIIFLKLRNGIFNETSITLPTFLSMQGIQQIIPPLITKIEQLWASLEGYKMILYPNISGKNGYEVVMSSDQVAGSGLK